MPIICVFRDFVVPLQNEMMCIIYIFTHLLIYKLQDND